MRNNSTSNQQWFVFGTKNPNTTQSFQDMCYLLFCKHYGITEGTFASKNHKALETDCIEFKGESIGFQVKYYEPTVKLSDKQSELKEALKKIRNTYSEVKRVHFYLNKSFGSGKTVNNQVSEKKKELDELAQSLKLEVIWEVESKLFIQIENYEAVKKKYFKLHKSVNREKRIEIARTAQIQLEIERLNFKLNRTDLNDSIPLLNELYIYQDFTNSEISKAVLEFLYDIACCVSVYTKPDVLIEVAYMAHLYSPRKMGKDKGLKSYCVELSLEILFSLAYDSILRLKNAECLWTILEEWRHIFTNYCHYRKEEKPRKILLENIERLEDTAKRAESNVKQDAMELLTIYNQLWVENKSSQPILPDALYNNLRNNYKTIT